MKFTPAGGAVNVRASVYEKDEGFLLVEVSDTGCGIRPEAITRIFEHLYQVTDPNIDPGRAGRRGLGLGLHIARELVTRLGGEIWVTSEPQKGSHFFFTLRIFSVEGSMNPIPTREKKKPGEELRFHGDTSAGSDSCRPRIVSNTSDSREMFVELVNAEVQDYLNAADLEGRA